jgi:hypothetical protein
MEQTEVEWLYEELWKQTDFSLPNNILEQAKEMERDQAVEFGYDIADYLACGVLSKKDIEDRYNEFLNSEEDEND